MPEGREVPEGLDVSPKDKLQLWVKSKEGGGGITRIWGCVRAGVLGPRPQAHLSHKIQDRKFVSGIKLHDSQ